MTTTCQRVALISSGSTSWRERETQRERDRETSQRDRHLLYLLSFCLNRKVADSHYTDKSIFSVMQIYSPLMAFNAGTPILLSSWPPETTGLCDIGRMRRRVSVKQDILRPRGCEHRRTETPSSSLSSFLTFYSRFNKGIMVIVIRN
jgi:hypothetical protein